MSCLIRCLFLLLLLAVGAAGAEESRHLDTRLMLSTVKVANPGSTAAAFVLRRNGETEASLDRFVLVTATHVLEKATGEEVTLELRKRQSGEGHERLPTRMKIREGDRPLWTSHPTADVAVISIDLPPEATVPGVSVESLATEEQLRHYEVRPGDAIRSIGFPHANQFQSEPAGFPMVRAGCIASYPLRPTDENITFYADLNTFEGDSGGPVYLAQVGRFYQGKFHGEPVELILGVMSGQQFINERFDQVYQSGEFRRQLGLGIIVHAVAIRQTLALLDESSEPTAADTVD